LLTKPLGTGLISTALKAGRASAVDVEQSVRWMSTLNRSACEAMVRAKASAATDITGYGLLGHLVELARSSGVSVTIRASAVPMLPGALAYAREGHSAGGTWTNLEYVAPNVEFDEGVEDAVRALLADPQTSGGLLVCLPSDSVPAFVKAAATDMLAVGIGEMQSDTPGKVRVLS
jgi:selenide,water dikinase